MSKSKVSFLINVDICVKKDGDEFYAFCPGLKGLHTCGTTVKEAVENGKNAVVAYILSLLKNHEPIPCCRIVREEQNEESCENAKLFSENVAIPQLVES